MTPPPTLRIGITPGDPRGVGPEVLAGALVGPAAVEPPAACEFLLVGAPELVPPEIRELPHVTVEEVGRWSGGDDAEAGRASVAAVQRAVDLALDGELDGIVTGPISKAAVAAAGYPWPGHTELLEERCGAAEVTMIMGAERTPLGGPLRIALLTAHVALRDVPRLLTPALVERRSRLAAAALRDWWGIPAPRLAFAGLNPHASEGGLFGDEEARVLLPAMQRLERSDGLRVSGPFPADTVFRRCVQGEVDIVVAPYHDVGLAVLKTIAPENGINVTAGLPFPRTSPDHGTAFDIAGRGRADARSMRAAVEACIRFCTTAATEQRENDD